MRIVGMLLCAAGVVWALQGSGLLPGSFMTGDRTWLVVGGVTAIASLVLVFRR